MRGKKHKENLKGAQNYNKTFPRKIFILRAVRGFTET